MARVRVSAQAYAPGLLFAPCGSALGSILPSWASVLPPFHLCLSLRRARAAVRPAQRGRLPRGAAAKRGLGLEGWRSSHSWRSTACVALITLLSVPICANLCLSVLSVCMCACQARPQASIRAKACEQGKGGRTLKRCLMPKCSRAKSQSDLGRPVTTAIGYLAASFSRTCVCVCVCACVRAAKNAMSATLPALIPAEPQPLWAAAPIEAGGNTLEAGGAYKTVSLTSLPPSLHLTPSSPSHSLTHTHSRALGNLEGGEEALKLLEPRLAARSLIQLLERGCHLLCHAGAERACARPHTPMSVCPCVHTKSAHVTCACTCEASLLSGPFSPTSSSCMCAHISRQMHGDVAPHDGATPRHTHVDSTQGPWT